MTRASMPELLLEEQLRGAGIPYDREVRFAPPRKWRADFVVPSPSMRRGTITLLPKYLIEVEGGAWVQGRHNRGPGFIADLEKYNMAAEMGWTVLRYTPAMIEDGSALAQIQRVLGL